MPLGVRQGNKSSIKPIEINAYKMKKLIQKMEVKVGAKDCRVKFKGINIFGVVITTKSLLKDMMVSIGTVEVRIAKINNELKK